MMNTCYAMRGASAIYKYVCIYMNVCEVFCYAHIEVIPFIPLIY